ncbi:ADP-ribose glycohydrolase MACROD2-like [Ostrea edulis]|uniref:ADP-ribose glycohydrolase MACROD2-like n=1 Tax=Ostrea edulis TaxID=37623 RepID=UPI0024AFEC55|nr:ADP-ribose glycohydrolase MACROD2-like [Ostrea edulis]
MRVIFSSHTVAREINSNLSHRFRVVIGGIFPSSQFEFRSLFSMSKKTSLETKSTNEDDRDELISATTPSRKITRNVHNESVISDRDKFLEMSKGDKRKLYKCGKKFKQLDDVPTWSEFYSEHKDRLKKAVSKKRLKVLYKVNEDINQRVSIWKGDITTIEIDAITNAANSSLLGGGGVDGAIHSAAGKKLIAECATLNGCDTGDAKITAGYKLPAKYVIHTVGPIGEKKELLSRAYSSVLNLVKENKLVSVAIPCISTGIYGYPNEQACLVALKTVRDFLEKDNIYRDIERVIFCLFMPKDVAIYEEQMQVYFPIADSAHEGDKVDIEMENMEDRKVNKKKADETEKVKEEKMEMERKEEEPKMEVEEEFKKDTGEEHMETEGKEVESEQRDAQLKMASKDEALTTEREMDTSEDNKSESVEKTDCTSDVSVQTKNKISNNTDKKRDASPEKKDKQKTGKQVVSNKPIKSSKTDDKSGVKEQSASVEGSGDEILPSAPLTRKTLRDSDTSDLHPQVKKQAKI